MSKTSNKKKKVSEYQKKKVYQKYNDCLLEKTSISYNDIDDFDLLNMCNDKDLFNKFKNSFYYAFLKEKTDNSVVIFLYLKFKEEDKDSVRVTQEIMESIAYMEKLFIFLDDIKIYRFNIDNNHEVVIKLLKSNFKLNEEYLKED